MLEATYILCGLFGLAMFATGFFVTLLEVIVGSPLDFLMSLLSPRRLNELLSLVAAHIRDKWPDSKLIGFMYYGGISLRVLAGALYCVDALVR
jgi:hypothetical protein